MFLITFFLLSVKIQRNSRVVYSKVSLSFGASCVLIISPFYWLVTKKNFFLLSKILNTLTARRNVDPFSIEMKLTPSFWTSKCKVIYTLFRFTFSKRFTFHDVYDVIIHNYLVHLWPVASNTVLNEETNIQKLVWVKLCKHAGKNIFR